MCVGRDVRLGRCLRAESDGDSTLQTRSMSVGRPGPLTSVSPSQLGVMGGMNSGDSGICLALSGLPDPRENQSSSYDCVEPSDPFLDKLMRLSEPLSPSRWYADVSSGQAYVACGSHERFTSEDFTVARGETTVRCDVVAALSISAISPSQKSIEEALKSIEEDFGPMGLKSLAMGPCSPLALTC